MFVPITAGSADSVPVPPGDHDQPYTFGRPLSTYVGNVHQHAALVLLRSRIDNACRHIGKRELQGMVIEACYANVHASATVNTVTVDLEPED
jgi:hypothetical protein